MHGIDIEIFGLIFLPMSRLFVKNSLLISHLLVLFGLPTTTFGQNLSLQVEACDGLKSSIQDDGSIGSFDHSEKFSALLFSDIRFQKYVMLASSIDFAFYPFIKKPFYRLFSGNDPPTVINF